MPSLSNKDWFILAIIFSVVSFCYKNLDWQNFNFRPEDYFEKADGIKIEYWNGDLNCPIFTARDDGSMLAVNLNSARQTEDKFSNGNALIVFDGYEVAYDGSYNLYGEYALLYNEKNNFYYVYYPRSWRFPEGAQFAVENPYQQKICKRIIKSSRKHAPIKLQY